MTPALSFSSLALALLLALVASGTSSSTFADDSTEDLAQGPCRQDIEKYCANVTPGGGRVIRCLKQNRSKLSKECIQKGRTLKQEAREIHDACKADVARFCKDVSRGQGRIIRCMREHRAEVSADCRKHAMELRDPEPRPSESPSP